MGSKAVSLAALGVLALTAAPALADAKLTRTGGLLGQSVTYNVDADSNEVFVLLPSFQSGPTPLGLFDPSDPRTLAVGIDLLSFLQVGSVNAAGLGTVILPLPNSASLQGVALRAQFVTVNLFGPGPIFDEISNVTSFKLSAKGKSTTTIGNLIDSLDSQTSTLLNDGRVLIAGGLGVDAQGNTITRDDFSVFDPQTQTFTKVGGKMQSGRAVHQAVKLNDGRVMLIGGLNQNNVVVKTVDIWNPNTNNSTPAAPMSVARVLGTATLLSNGRVLVTGGVSAFDLADPLSIINSFLASTEIYNPNTNSWLAGPNFPTQRAGQAATLLTDGRVLITGGIEITGLFLPTPGLTNECTRYTFATNGGSFQATANFGGARALHAQVRLDNGQVLVTGGAASFDALSLIATAANSCRRYNPTNNTWTNVAALSSARGFHQLLNVGGQVINIGGISSANGAALTATAATAIEVSPQNFISWSSPSSSILPRAFAVSTAIEGGARILTTGSGDNGNPNVFDKSGEVFHP